MAARRLIFILLLLLVASVVAASLAPNRRTIVSTPSTSSTPAPREPSPLPGDSLRLRASASKPATVEAFVGDQVELTISSDPARTIMIEPLGLTEFAEPDSPAHFNLLLRDAGAIPITDGDGNVVGRLQVSEPGAGSGSKGKPGEPQDPKGAPGAPKDKQPARDPRAAPIENT